MANIIDVIREAESKQSTKAVLDAMQAEVTRNGRTENGALSNSTTGSKCLNYWSKCGTYRGRKQKDVDHDMTQIFYEDEETALKIVFGLRLITRESRVLVNHIDCEYREWETSNVQTGCGQRDEFFKALRWMSFHHPELINRNFHLIPTFGSWKDFFSEELLECLDRKSVFALFRSQCNDELLRKYLPTIHSKGKKRGEHAKKKSQWAKEFCAFLEMKPQTYRKLKKSGNAHLFQRQMSQNKWDEIDFNTIPGRAMLHLNSRKGRDGKMAFERHGQIDRLTEWTMKQDKIKFTGYPYELTKAASRHNKPSRLQTAIFNKQFEQVIDSFKGHKLGNVFCALDTSGSMSAELTGGVTALQVCLSLGLVFSKLNLGWFRDAACHFAEKSSLIRFLENDDFVTRLHFLESMTDAMGNTNFQSVIDLLVAIRMKHPDIPVSQFPETLLIVSDMQFDPAGKSQQSVMIKSYYSQLYAANGSRFIMRDQVDHGMDEQTNYEAAKNKLAAVGLSEMRIIWWNVSGSGQDFPVQMNDKGTYLISGFDPVNLKALMGMTEEKKDPVATDLEVKQQTPMDGMNNFLSQEIFSLLRF